MASLWEARGRPPPGEALPPSRSPRWIAARCLLEGALRLQGCTERIRSASTLWQLVHCSHVPTGATWQALCGTQSVANVAAAVRARRSPLVCVLLCGTCVGLSTHTPLGR